MKDFARYLNQLRVLYKQGVSSNVSPSVLQRIGGVLALAANDAAEIRVEEDAYLWFDRRRNYAQVQRLAEQHWKEYLELIARNITRGDSPRRAVERLLRERGSTVPHDPVAVQQMIRLVTGSAGTMSQWEYDLAAFRQRVQRDLDVMTGSTFQSIAATTYFLATAKDWERGRPAEWDKAIAFGEYVGPLADLLEGVAEARATRPGRGRRRQSQRPRTVDRQRSTEGSVRATNSRRAIEADSRTTLSQRGTETASRGTTASARGKSENRPTPAHPPARGVDDAGDLRVDEAIGKDAPTETSPLRSRDRPRRRRSRRQVPSLDTLGLTRDQRRALRRVSNRFPSRFQREWRNANNELARERMREVKRLWRRGDQQAARRLARNTYNLYRQRFWRAVRKNPRLRDALEQAGFRFEGDDTTAPVLVFPDGYREPLTIEHKSRVTDEPWRAIKPENLTLVLFRENTNTLEFIRQADIFQNPPDAPPLAE